jgi:trigger factor
MLRRNSRQTTARALKEHFILERIAEDQEIDVTEEDCDTEIELIAAQTSESPRRVRARLEKSNSMDVLRNQVVERKVIDLILGHARFKEVPYEMPGDEEEAIDKAVGGQQQDIPKAETEAAEPAKGGRPEEPPLRQ